MFIFLFENWDIQRNRLIFRKITRNAHLILFVHDIWIAAEITIAFRLNQCILRQMNSWQENYSW